MALVRTVPCVICGEPATHFSPHSKEPLCWSCALQEETAKASAKLPKFAKHGPLSGINRDVYDAIELLREERCFSRPIREGEDGVDWLRATDGLLAQLVHAVRCNVTLCDDTAVDPIAVLEEMVEAWWPTES